MQRYNPTGKTVVTKVESFVVDTVRKTAAHTFDVAARADDNPLQMLDVNVTDAGYTAPSFAKHIAISCTESVDLELIQRETIETIPDVYYNGTLSTSNSVRPNKVITVALSDLDLEATTLSTTVTAQNTRTGDTKTVTLTRYEPDLTYIGALGTTTTSGQPPEAPELFAETGDSIVFTYEDPIGAAGQPLTITSSTTIDPVEDHTGIITMQDAFTPGDDLQLQVYDPQEQLSLTLVVRNDRTNETEAITLNETTIGSGVFKGVLPTLDDAAAGTDYDNVIQVAQSDVLVFTYNDLRDANGAPTTVEVSKTVGQTITGAGTITAFPAREGASITVEVSDVDRTGTLNVSAVNQTTGEIETIVLSETRERSKNFIGVLPTRRAEDNEIWYKGTDNDGSMDVKSSDIIDLVYNDPQGTSGEPIAIPTSVIISDAAALPDPPAPIISYETHTIKMSGKLFLFHGSSEDMSIRLIKPSSNTNDSVRCELTIV